ncbi:teichoic acid D-Ala incorporation-associated protein DltX [Bacillus ginsengihumi]|uniref:Teichoic acid D-Ala incorporation-associated protein DltX n=2 Tax=Heyndrickxia ginsengihumi TaxID=363870 RepID=A0A6M0P922_9BACI|nr:teichoic acid D-Ala incorporation-associated protein DltX [Heyndrickxia ginsengihumi]MBE6185112.1 teichoic acid D-Ala incorporation-associated protein DltX [Bacillus sp. (in: firmicutes)]MCM3024606.1 teichoic acid D-Ala incorporation-associated protein DltX [Heyndrickxia ginsengihumi]NEY20795.1 teichoic acid D-Ala incorporation-associated protein DltX [Heyndrickxia ginsengihumi]
MEQSKKGFQHPFFKYSIRTLYYLLILILLVLVYGFHDMRVGPFIYSEF